MRTRPPDTRRLSALCQRWCLCRDPAEAGELQMRIQRILRVARAFNRAGAARAAGRGSAA
jgi:hypothetical protein